MTLKATKQFPGAIDAYRQAIQIRPDYAEAHQNLGVVLLKLGRVAEGMNSFRRAIVLYDRRQSPVARQLRQALDEMGFQI
jgi:Flp pilus assembly protein TadD